MRRPVPFIAIVLLALCVEDSCAIGATLHAQLFPHTGEVRLRNKGTTPVTMVFYSINSPSGALNSSPSVWKSVASFYDVSGNGFIDPNDEWVIIRALSTELTEGAPIGDGGSLAAQRAVSLGQIWNPNVTSLPDLVFAARELNEQPITVVRELAINGDYLPDGVVNQLDYGVWRQGFGSTTVLQADGNLDGIVNTADYIIWRNNVGLQLATVTGAAVPPLSPAAVPEPGTVAMLLTAYGLYYLARTRRRPH